MKIQRLSQPDVRPIKESGDLYELYEDYAFKFINKRQLLTATIKKGFKYDGASVPRIVWTLAGFLPDGIHRPAALIHDYMYEKEGKIPVDGGELEYTRKEADKLFFDALRFLGIKSWHARIAYISVRLFGRLYW